MRHSCYLNMMCAWYIIIISLQVKVEKQNIMEELDLLNINEGFLFPELEYQSKNVVQYVQKKISPQKEN